MSKYVKNLIADHLRERLQGVDEALLVNVVGLDANTNNRLRAVLQAKDIHLIAVKNSLAALATAGTPLAAMFEGLTGTAAICWGGEDLVTLAKEIIRLARDGQYASFVPRGGMMDGQRLGSAEVAEVSTWPGRAEQLGMLLGQILSPGANLASQLAGPGAALASQVDDRAGEEADEEAEGPQDGDGLQEGEGHPEGEAPQDGEAPQEGSG